MPAPVTVGLLRIALRIEGARSRKDRRRVVRSLTARLRARCLVAAADTGDPESLRDAEVSVVAVGLGRPAVAARLTGARDLAIRAFPSEFVDAALEWPQVPDP